MNDGVAGHGTVLVPVGQRRELPEQALMVLRALWARLGYQADSFVDMQMEIAKELAHADFARFEREMLCNEIISLKQELELVRVDRNEQKRRAEERAGQLAIAIETEARTFEALVAEREISKRALEQAERGVTRVVEAKEKEAARAGRMGEEIHRLEKERLAAMLYARTAEEQAAMANRTAQTAAAVALSAVQATTPRVGFAPEPVFSPAHRHAPLPPRSPHRPVSPAPSPSAILPPSRSHTPNLSAQMARLSSHGSPANNRGCDPNHHHHHPAIQNSLREHQLQQQESQLAADLARLAEDRIKLRLDSDRLARHTPTISYQDLRP